MNVDSSCSTPTHVTTASQSPVSISSPSRSVEFSRSHLSAASIWSTQQRCGTGVASPSSVDPTDVCRGRVSSVTPADRDRSLGVTTNAKPGTSMRSRHSLPMPSIISVRNLEWECLQSHVCSIEFGSCPWLFLAVCGASPTLRFLLGSSERLAHHCGINDGLAATLSTVDGRPVTSSRLAWGEIEREATLDDRRLAQVSFRQGRP